MSDASVCVRCRSPLDPACSHVGHLCCACADMDGRRLLARLDVTAGGYALEPQTKEDA